MVGLKSDLLKVADWCGYLPLLRAAQKCPENVIIKFMINVYPQALVTMCRCKKSLLFHVLLKYNFCQGVINLFF